MCIRDRQCAADAAGVPIERHAGAVAEIEAQYGESAYPKRVLMADFPQGAALIPNPVNRVAGFSLHQHYFVPGFPEMAHPMVEWVLDTQYAHLFHQTAYLEQSIIVADGIESRLIDLMNAVITKFDVKVCLLYTSAAFDHTIPKPQRCNNDYCKTNQRKWVKKGNEHIV